MWYVAELTEEYIGKMEDVLEVYEKPFSATEPVVCVDEKSVTLRDDVRDPLPMKPGSVAKRGCEYERCGTANVFCGVEPKAGQHFTKVTPRRCSPEFAGFLHSIASHYPQAETIHLVMDNLSTHTRKAMVDRFGKQEGDLLWNRFTVHYTPKHGSWLNQVEIEIGLFSRQCLGKRRIPDESTLRRQAHAWNRRMNRRRVKINWGFTRQDARRMFKYKKPKPKRNHTKRSET